MQNTPYVKKFNQNGELLNPIIGYYQSRSLVREKWEIVAFPNRSQRRSASKNSRRNMVVQVQELPNGNRILHFHKKESLLRSERIASL